MTSAAQRLVFRDAFIYSPDVPFATSLIVDGGCVSWIGGDAGLTGQLLPDDQIVECQGALVTPAFFDAWLSDSRTIAPDFVGGLLNADPEALIMCSGLGLAGTPVAATGLDQYGGRSHPVVRLSDTTEVTDQAIRTWLETRTFVVTDPTCDPALAQRLLAQGVPFALGSRDASPEVGNAWHWVRSLVFGENGGISGRAAFNCVTRSGWRLAGLPDRGVLRVGAPADLNLWMTDHLAVQVPDERVRAWSTDVRAGTPPLPDLSPGAELPELVGRARGAEFEDLRS